MITENPIEEIWRIREDIAREDDYDLSTHFARLRELEKVERLIYTILSRFLNRF
jgi:hypothetical protein